MKTIIKVDDFLFLIMGVYADFVSDETSKFLETNMDLSLAMTTFVPSPAKFKYINLKDQIETYKLNNTPVDIRIHPIDEFMVDCYKSLCRYENLVKDINEEIGDNFFFVSEDDGVINDNQILEIKEKLTIEHKKFKSLFEDIMLNCEFTYPEISGIQRNYLNDMLKESVLDENYEQSALIRDRIINLKYE